MQESRKEGKEKTGKHQLFILNSKLLAFVREINR
jgi:hypothetical protein